MHLHAQHRISTHRCNHESDARVHSTNRLQWHASKWPSTTGSMWVAWWPQATTRASLRAAKREANDKQDQINMCPDSGIVMIPFQAVLIRGVSTPDQHYTATTQINLPEFTAETGDAFGETSSSSSLTPSPN